MKVSKSAVAVALSSALLFGCDFDVGSENSSTGGGTGGDDGGTPTSALVGPYWDIGHTSSATQTVDLPNVYIFDGKNSHYYDDDATPGTYKITTTPYSDDIEAGTITFTYYNEGAETEVTGSYTVEAGKLVVESSSFGKLTGNDEATNADIAAAVKAANDASGFNRLVQIRDTSDSARGELRLKLSDSSTNAAVSDIQVGKLTVDLTYQDGDTGGAADGKGENAYISLFASGTSNSNLHGEVIFENDFGNDIGKIKYRDNTGTMQETGDTFELGEPLTVEANWDETTFSFVVNGNSYGPFPVADESAVQVISLKIGDTTNTTNFELLADNFKVYNIEGADEELVFEDNFDGYSLGHNLSGNPYNNNSKEAIVVDGSGGSTPPGGGDDNEIVDTPSGKFVALYDNNANDAGEIRYSLPTSQRIHEQGKASVYIKNKSDQTALMNVYGLDEGEIIQVRLRENGKIVHRPESAGSSWIETGTTVDPLEWNKLSVEWDTNAGNDYKLFVNGNLIGEYERRITKAGISTRYIAVQVGTGSSNVIGEGYGTIDIDNLALYSDTAGTTALHKDDFESFELGTDLGADPSTTIYDKSGYNAIVEE
ncbi:hypothetical protein [Vibrio comitans]|uniref:Uncharacterized protein n=1 Tax=Vibrio comitans NBRC 102076 TaxID=1219078 RepID=A0A4Y3IID3_9VIBR|nr:hypothetical protein [Vibrio comitans]GEA59223.1 hypothetical protein VCO01S_04160 [Vibrio comitans NBRC 102076]